MLISWPSGPTIIEFASLVQANKEGILRGRLIAVDPGISAGYAIYEKGKLVENDVCKVDPNLDMGARCHKLAKFFRNKGKFDVFVIEQIRGNMAHVYLKFAIGAIIGGSRADARLEIPIRVWQALREDDYKKTDKKDAELMGQATILLAKGR